MSYFAICCYTENFVVVMEPFLCLHDQALEILCLILACLPMLTNFQGVKISALTMFYFLYLENEYTRYA